MEPAPRTTFGKRWQVSGRASYTEQALPSRKTQPASLVRRRIRPSSSSALAGIGARVIHGAGVAIEEDATGLFGAAQNSAFVFFIAFGGVFGHKAGGGNAQRSEEHTSELQSLRHL